MKYIIRFVLRHVPRKYIQYVSHFATKTLSLFYMGNKVACPVCGKHYRKFLPYGYVTPRENALCPWCLSLERHRLLWMFMQQETNFFTSNGQVLHIAPEYCFMKPFEKSKGENYLTADMESPLARIKMNVESIPLQDNSVEVVLCNHVLEHVENDRQALREFYRVLKPGGWAILQVPLNSKRQITYEDSSIVDPIEREKHFGQKDHVREYGLDYGQRLSEAGFSVKEIPFAHTLPQDQVTRYALPKDEIIYYCQKS